MRKLHLDLDSRSGDLISNFIKDNFGTLVHTLQYSHVATVKNRIESAIVCNSDPSNLPNQRRTPYWFKRPGGRLVLFSSSRYPERDIIDTLALTDCPPGQTLGLYTNSAGTVCTCGGSTPCPAGSTLCSDESLYPNINTGAYTATCGSTLNACPSGFYFTTYSPSDAVSDSICSFRPCHDPVLVPRYANIGQCCAENTVVDNQGFCNQILGSNAGLPQRRRRRLHERALNLLYLDQAEEYACPDDLMACPTQSGGYEVLRSVHRPKDKGVDDSFMSIVP